MAGKNSDLVQKLAEELNMEWRSFITDDKDQIKQGLEGVSCVLNAAGPFYKTSYALIDECNVAGNYYLDITGEIRIFEYAEKMGDAAAKAGVILMPGIGWDVVPTDCLSLHTALSAEQPHSIRLLVRHVDLVSTRGSIRTGDQFAGFGNLARRNGNLVTIEEATTEFNIGLGSEPFRIAPLPDVITIWKTTAVPNIAIYAYDPVAGPSLSNEEIEAFPEGGNDEETARAYSLAAAEVTDINGKVFVSTIKTISPYAYTGYIVAEIATRILCRKFSKSESFFY